MITIVDLLWAVVEEYFYPLGLEIGVQLVEDPNGELLDAFWCIRNHRTGVTRRV